MPPLTRAHLARLEMANGEAEEVSRDDDLLLEVEGRAARTRAALTLAPLADRAHQRRCPSRHGHRRVVRKLGGRRVLAREQCARVDRLALREEVRVDLARRELLGEPLARRRLWRRLIRDHQLELGQRLCLVRELDGERLTEGLVRVAERVARRRALD
eukprot:5918069-Prymnesium_polylepis.1